MGTTLHRLFVPRLQHQHRLLPYRRPRPLPLGQAPDDDSGNDLIARTGAAGRPRSEHPVSHLLILGTIPVTIGLMTRRVLLYPGEDGFIVAEVPSLPGCISQGMTREEALADVREAISLHEEVLRERGEPTR